jgi:hypothetical protein
MKALLAAAVFCVLAANARAADTVPFGGKIDVVCGQGVYICVSDEEIRALTGKTLKYHHLRPDEFGDVSIQLKKEATAYGFNRKGGSGPGTWDAKDGKLLMKFSGWGDTTLPLVRIGDHLFWIATRAGSVLVPIEITE